MNCTGEVRTGYGSEPTIGLMKWIGGGSQENELRGIIGGAVNRIVIFSALRIVVICGGMMAAGGTTNHVIPSASCIPLYVNTI